MASGLFSANWWPFCQVFTLTLIYIPILKSIRPKLAILSPKILQKLTKVAISQNPILPKCHSPKSLLLLHFSTNFSETFRINVNMDFAHTNHGRFFLLFRPPKKIWAQNQKSAKISMCKINIYIDSERFRKFIEKCRRSRLFGQNGVLRYGHFGEFLVYFWR